MSENVTSTKLEIIKELTTDKSVAQLCDVMIDYVQATQAQKIGFAQDTAKGGTGNPV